jgi:uncharacterized membrane protein YccC
LDVAYKSVLRVVGAAAGTVIASMFSIEVGYQGAARVVLMLGAIFLGVWLRPLGYAWWALFITLALALLQGFTGSSLADILEPRLEEIVLGALIAVASAWFVFPVRSTSVMRRRIADALARLSEALDPATSRRRPDDFVAAVAGVKELAAAFRASRLVTRKFRAIQPADWADVLTACTTPAVTLIEKGETPGLVRRAIGAARKSMREPGEILGAMQELNRSLAEQAVRAQVTSGAEHQTRD